MNQPRSEHILVLRNSPETTSIVHSPLPGGGCAHSDWRRICDVLRAVDQWHQTLNVRESVIHITSPPHFHYRKGSILFLNSLAKSKFVGLGIKH